MSADNGIYILTLKDQVRVIHEQNSENCFWDWATEAIDYDQLNYVTTWLV